jgi:XapX domain-containing protein
MKLLIGVFVSMLVGAGCRFFDIPVPSPPILPGALLVVAMTFGYSAVDRVMVQRARASTTQHLCGGPTGMTEEARRRLDSEGLRVAEIASEQVVSRGER